MSIRLKFLLPLLLLAFLFLLSIKFVVWPQFVAAELEQHIVDERKKIEMLGTTLTHPLLNSDLAQIYSILDNVLEKHPHWRYIVLTDLDGTAIYPLQKMALLPDENLVAIQHYIQFFGTPVATLLLNTDVSPIHQQHNSFALQSGTLIVILMIVAVTISIILQEKLITRPMRSLAVASQKMADGDFDALLPNAGPDEVGQLICSFDSMRGEVKSYQDKLHDLAHYDILTGLPNRVMFFDRLEHAITQAHRSKKALGLLFLDLDNFKKINDTLGHSTGDALLVSVAKRLIATMREGDTIARLGGDEFTAIIENMKDAKEAEIAAQRIVGAFNSPVQAGNHEIQVGVSIGVTIYPMDTTEITTLIRNADIAMYQAKATNSGAYRFFTRDETGRDQT